MFTLGKPTILKRTTTTKKITRKGFFFKNIVAVSFFQTVPYTNILNTCKYLFH